MRVLFVTHNFPRYAGDAAGSFVLHLAQALATRNIDVQVVAPATPELIGRDTVQGIPVDRIVYARPSLMTLAYEGTMAEAVRESWGARLAFANMFRVLRRAALYSVDRARIDGKPFDIIHAHWWFPAGVSVWMASGRSGMPPFGITMHGSDVRLARTKTWMHPLMRRVLGAASFRTAVSGWLAAEAQRITKCAVDVAPMPVDTEKFELNEGPRDNSILFVGRLNAQKGVSDLLQAFARGAMRPSHLHVVGEGPDGDSLRSMASDLGVAQRVTWHGKLAHEQLIPLYQRSRVVAIPSREEGLGLVAVEAQLCGTPVVAYDSGGLNDVVDIRGGSALVPEGDVSAFAGALERLTRESPSGFHAADSRSTMIERFSPDAVARTYEQRYRAALGNAHKLSPT